MPDRTRGFAVANIAWAAIFFLGAAVQYNDPDPWRWISIYAAGGVACVVYQVGRRSLWFPLVVALAALIWAGVGAAHVIPELRFGDLFRSMKAENPAIEESREFLGLLLIAAWMAVLVFRTRHGSAGAGKS